MRLAATLRPVRGAPRRSLRLPGTLRDPGERPCDIAILDISASGFLAELPAWHRCEAGARIRVAAVGLGRHEAVAVRRDGDRCGFVFARPLPAGIVEALDLGATSVTPLFALDAPPPSGRSPGGSLALVAAIAGGIWSLLALLLYLTA